MDQVSNINGFNDLSENTKKCILSRIQRDRVNFSFDDLNEMFNDQSFDIQFLSVFLKLFPKSSVELKYPSNNFKQKMEKITKLKKNEVKNLHIALIISSFIGLTQENFDYTDIDSVVIENTVSSIPSYAFKGCQSLKNIIIPESVTQIEEGSFLECSSLASIEFPSSITSIGSSAFAGCSSLSKVKIPSSVTTIKTFTFLLCENMKSLEIPSSVTSIESCAFAECGSLMIVNIPSSVTSIGEGAFCDCSLLCYLKIPSSVVSIGSQAFSGCPLAGKAEIPSRFNLKEIGISNLPTVVRN